MSGQVTEVGTKACRSHQGRARAVHGSGTGTLCVSAVLTSRGRRWLQGPDTRANAATSPPIPPSTSRSNAVDEPPAKDFCRKDESEDAEPSSDQSRLLVSILLGPHTASVSERPRPLQRIDRSVDVGT